MQMIEILLTAFKQALFPTAILALHIGAIVESIVRGDLLRTTYFCGGAVLTFSVILMGVQK